MNPVWLIVIVLLILALSGGVYTYRGGYWATGPYYGGGFGLVGLILVVLVILLLLGRL